MKPIKGMKEEPDGLPLMMPAWIGCVRRALGEKGARDEFKRDTGLDLESLVNRTPIDKMIDWSTGYERAVFCAFCDWVTVNLWGKIPKDTVCSKSVMKRVAAQKGVGK